MKITSKVLIACLVTSSGLGFSEAVFAETVMKIKATGVVILNMKNIELADGSFVQVVDNKYVFTDTEGETAGQSSGGVCYALGKVTPEGVYSGMGRCETTYNAEDSYTMDYVDNAEGGDWVVTGGKGKFKGATGGGHTTYTWGDTVFGDKVAMTTEGTITLP